ncbi:hypothetical protein CRUP_019998 [Coryphaenoides rupestris]|nr:hypothetical protein CRUP_019998 [Coryphaenoides rupestris]
MKRLGMGNTWKMPEHPALPQSRRGPCSPVTLVPDPGLVSGARPEVGAAGVVYLGGEAQQAAVGGGVGGGGAARGLGPLEEEEEEEEEEEDMVSSVPEHRTPLITTASVTASPCQYHVSWGQTADRPPCLARGYLINKQEIVRCHSSATHAAFGSAAFLKPALTVGAKALPGTQLTTTGMPSSQVLLPFTSTRPPSLQSDSSYERLQ